MDKLGTTTAKKLVVKLLSDEKDDIENENEENLFCNNSCQNVVLKEIMQYFNFIKKLLLKVEEEENMNKQIKQNILLIKVKACNTMENYNNNLKKKQRGQQC